MKFQTKQKESTTANSRRRREKKNTNYNEPRKTKCCVEFTIGTIC
jgi:hypothetical protein